MEKHGKSSTVSYKLENFKCKKIVKKLDFLRDWVYDDYGIGTVLLCASF